MPKLEDLTQAAWSNSKNMANIKKTPKLKALFGGSASVGPAIASFQKARAEWNAENPKTYKTASKYYGAISNVKKALEKFEKIKEFTSDEAKALKAEVVAWGNDAARILNAHGSYIVNNQEALKAADKGALKDALGTTGMAGTGGMAKPK